MIARASSRNLTLLPRLQSSPDRPEDGRAHRGILRPRGGERAHPAHRDRGTVSSAGSLALLRGGRLGRSLHDCRQPTHSSSPSTPRPAPRPKLTPATRSPSAATTKASTATSPRSPALSLPASVRAMRVGGYVPPHRSHRGFGNTSALPTRRSGSERTDAHAGFVCAAYRRRTRDRDGERKVRTALPPGARSRARHAVPCGPSSNRSPRVRGQAPCDGARHPRRRRRCTRGRSRQPCARLLDRRRDGLRPGGAVTLRPTGRLVSCPR